MGLCLRYKRRSYTEMYLGAMVVMMIVLGIPTCIGTIEFMLNYKFCRTEDEELDALIGGMTICEAFTYALTCGKSERRLVTNEDDYVYKYQI